MGLPARIHAATLGGARIYDEGKDSGMRQTLFAAVAIVSILTSLQVSEAGHRARATTWSRPPHRLSTGWAIPYDDQTKMIICTNRPIPPQWVIVGVRHAVNCNGLGNNAWIIQRLPNYPGADMIICGCQPVPPGWTVVEEVKTHHCGHGVNGLRIRKM